MDRCNATTTQKCLAMSYKTRHDEPVVQLQSLQEKWKYMSRKYLYKSALAALLLVSKTENRSPVGKGICSVFLFIRKILLISKREHTTEPCNSVERSQQYALKRRLAKRGQYGIIASKWTELPGMWERWAGINLPVMSFFFSSWGASTLILLPISNTTPF